MGQSISYATYGGRGPASEPTLVFYEEEVVVEYWTKQKDFIYYFRVVDDRTIN